MYKKLESKTILSWCWTHKWKEQQIILVSWGKFWETFYRSFCNFCARLLSRQAQLKCLLACEFIKLTSLSVSFAAKSGALVPRGRPEFSYAWPRKTVFTSPAFVVLVLSFTFLRLFVFTFTAASGPPSFFVSFWLIRVKLVACRGSFFTFQATFDMWPQWCLFLDFKCCVFLSVLFAVIRPSYWFVVLNLPCIVAP